MEPTLVGPALHPQIHTTSLRTLSGFFMRFRDVMNLSLKAIMHDQFPFRLALILVLGPSVLSLLLARFAHSLHKSKSAKEEEPPAAPDRPDESRSVLPNAVNPQSPQNPVKPLAPTENTPT